MTYEYKPYGGALGVDELIIGAGAMEPVPTPGVGAGAGGTAQPTVQDPYKTLDPETYTYGGPTTGGGASNAPVVSTPGGGTVTQIQQAIVAGGCTLPRYGVDGQWGYETRAGVECLSARTDGGLQTLVARFPNLAALMERRTAPSVPAVRQGEEEIEERRAGLLPFDIPWWGVAGGVGVLALGVAGYLAYKKAKEEEERYGLGER